MWLGMREDNTCYAPGFQIFNFTPLLISDYKVYSPYAIYFTKGIILWEYV